jgi:hypothetical protein
MKAIASWLKNNSATAAFGGLLSLLGIFAAAQFLGGWHHTPRIGRSVWLLLTLFCAAVWLATRTWRHKEAAMRPALLRQQVLLKSLSLMATVACSLNLLPKQYWQAFEADVFGYFKLAQIEQQNKILSASLVQLELTKCSKLDDGATCREVIAKAQPGGASAKPDEINKEIQESINRWGTLFAWLLAVAAIVITAITGWVVGLLKEARDNLTAVKNDQNLNAQQLGMQLDLDTTKCQLRIAQLLHVLDKEKAQNWRTVCFVYQKLAWEVQNLHAGTVDCVLAAMSLETRLATLTSATKLEPDTRCSRLGQEFLAPCLSSHIDALRHEPHLQGEGGRRALQALAGLVRVIRRL